MPNFDGRSEYFELFENLFLTSQKIHNQLTEGEKLKYFPFVMKWDALRAFESISNATPEYLGEIMAVMSTKRVKLQSMDTAKHKFQKLVFNPANRKIVDFLYEYQRLAKDVSETAAQAIIEQIIDSKMPLHLQRLQNQAQF